MLEWMIRAGCYCISFGVESASETVLKAIKKAYPKTNRAHLYAYKANGHENQDAPDGRQSR